MGVYTIRTPINFGTKEISMYNIEYDVKLFNQIVTGMVSVEPYAGYRREIAIVRKLVDEGIRMTRDYLESISLDDLEDMMNLIQGMADEDDNGLIQEMSDVSSAKLSLEALRSNKNAVLDDEDFF